MAKRILITGGMGFVGHHFVEEFLRNTDYEIVALDKLSYASQGFDRLRDIEAFDDKRVTILSTDFTQPLSEGVKREIGDVEYILHLGAESHVDNSIKNPEPFVRSNVVGTMHMLDFARELPNLKCFFYFGTDEVFGPAPEGVSYKEDDRHNPGNPYSAAKSGGEMLVKAYGNTYKLPYIITRSMNIFGERQHPEKFIPLVLKKVLAGEVVTIHANKEKTKAGSRFYIHARNVANGYRFLIDKIEKGEDVLQQDYHITGEKEVDNLELAQLIASFVGEEYLKYEMVDFHSSRPGHDLRYALDGSKMKHIGWEPSKTMEESLKKTIEWFMNNKHWL
jgi:dTDP-glucose 4,6-dehydratase